MYSFNYISRGDEAAFLCPHLLFALEIHEMMEGTNICTCREGKKRPTLHLQQIM